ncbi:MAG: S9 family peptidase [Candidatus Azobacteroides sp.]|nr:S9 family peptidase [Candidatus Azobacteroides sp.]
MLTLEDLIPGGSGYESFIPEKLEELQWKGDEYTYKKNKDTLIIISPATPDKSAFITSQQLNDALISFRVKKISDLPSFFFLPQNPDIAVFWHDKHLFLYDTVKKVIRYALKKNGAWENEEFSPSESDYYLAYTEKNNLYIATPEKEIIAITKETDPGIVSGQAVHREEFGIRKGIFWSPAGNYLAFYRMDETMVENYPLVNISAREAKAEPIKYPMAGMKSHQVKIGIFDVQKKKTVFLKTGYPKDRYFTNIAWSPDEKLLYIAEVNRRQDTCQLNTYDIKTGRKVNTLFEETHAKYVEPKNPPLFLKTKNQFIWQSARDGFNHLYLYHTDGTLIKQLTSGKWTVTEIAGMDEKEEYLFYLSTEEDPLEIHAYKLHISTGERTRITSETGVHSISVSKSGKYILDVFSSPQVANKTELIYPEENRNVTLLSAADPYKEFRMPEIRIGTLKAADDSTDLYYRITTPVDFDPAKKYPVIVYVYGGPQIRLVEKRWLSGARPWDIYMAQKGYIIFTLDNRGSAKRGLEFENVTYHQLGVNEAKDQYTGIEYLRTLPYVDTGRIGVHGWSFGGYMCTNLMLRYPEVFKAGVSGAPVIDWKYYEIMYGERYMGTPKSNPEGYKESNLNNKADRLAGRLLLIHGDMDPVVVWQHSLSFLKASVSAGTFPDYFVYPGYPHHVTGKDAIHLYEKITRYFEEHL